MQSRFQQHTQLSSRCEYTSDSRSTSAGSHESTNHKEVSRHKCLPEIDYPVPVIVRNTFIETQLGRPDSLDEFYRERQIRSSPPVPREDRQQSSSDDDAQPDLRRAITAGAQALMSSVASAAGFWACKEEECPTPPSDDFDEYAQAQMPRVLFLSQALAEPMLGSPHMPTVGSAGHHVGKCKPCAFFHTRGCENGVQCPFCHLCPPDEKRRRQKDKQAAFREMRSQRKQLRF
jgi:hypothetical protein